MATQSKLPQVQLTQEFREELEAEGADPEVLIEAFAEWKEDWPRFEDGDYFFGKDGQYSSPTRVGKRVLTHVHMPPEDPENWPADAPPLTPAQKAKIEGEVRNWDRMWNLRRAARYRTSSRVLVYVDGGRHGYLLLRLAREPDGHDATTADRQLMNHLADVAEAFIHDGSIII